jgi:hypothetical protein
MTGPAFVLRREIGAQSAPAARLAGGRLEGEGGGRLPHPGWGLPRDTARRVTTR